MTGRKMTKYDDFSAPTAMRYYELVVGGDKTLYINPGWLGELSGRFHALFFGPEADANRSELPDENHENMLELMRCMCDCPTLKPIDDKNVAAMLHMAHNYDIRSLLDRCEAHIRKHILLLDTSQLFTLTKTLAICDKRSDVMRLLVRRMANLHRVELQSHSFEEIPGDVVADIFMLKLQMRHDKKKVTCI